MASAKSKSASASTGPIKKSKSAAPSTNGTSTPIPPPSESPSETTSSAPYGHGKPGKALFDSEQEKIKAEIDALQPKLFAVKEKIGLSGRGGAGNDRRTTLRAELETIRSQQSSTKLARGKVFDQLKALQDGVQKKIKDLNTAKGKIPYKTVAEVDDRIKHLEKQVESGNLKLVDEKRALQEISQCRRNRRAVEGFQAEQEAIEADRAAADEIRKQLDDPEAKAISDRYEAIKAELDELKKEGDEAYANRSKLMDERTALQTELDNLYNQKRESSQRFREANDHYFAKVSEDRARRAEKYRAQRAAEEDAKKQETVERLREEASVPAFQAQIEDCQTLADYFSGKTSAPAVLSTTPKTDLAGVAKLEIRTVAAPPEGLVARKKKGEDEESYFAGKGKRGKKGGAKATSPTTGPSESSSGQLHVPLTTLSALLSLSIPPPTSAADIPRLVEDLNTKKAWFQANQARVTAEAKAKTEAEIERLIGKSEKVDGVSPSTQLTPPNGGAERPAEPAPTPATDKLVSTAVESEVVTENLEAVLESEGFVEEA